MFLVVCDKVTWCKCDNDTFSYPLQFVNQNDGCVSFVKILLDWNFVKFVGLTADQTCVFEDFLQNVL